MRAKLDALAECGYTSSEENETMLSNIAKMTEDCGGDEMIELETFFHAPEEFERRHRSLLMCDRLEFNMKEGSKYKEFRMIPLIWPEDGMVINLLDIRTEHPLYKLMDNVKITGVFIGGITFWSNETGFPPNISKLLVFYDVDKGGDDDEDGGPDCPTESEIPDDEPALAEVLRILNPVSSTR